MELTGMDSDVFRFLGESSRRRLVVLSTTQPLRPKTRMAFMTRHNDMIPDWIVSTMRRIGFFVLRAFFVVDSHFAAA